VSINISCKNWKYAKAFEYGVVPCLSRTYMPVTAGSEICKAVGATVSQKHLHLQAVKHRDQLAWIIESMLLIKEVQSYIDVVMS
jgi:hypothetical protein